jgi:hypothetical protein
LINKSERENKMKFAVDLTLCQDFKPLPAGTYAIKIIDIDGSKVSKSGNPKLSVKTEILAPASVAQTTKYWWFSLSLVESALFRVKQLFEACNVTISKSGFDTTDLAGREVGVTVIEENTPEYGHRNQIVSFTKAKETKPELKPAVAVKPESK